MNRHRLSGASSSRARARAALGVLLVTAVAAGCDDSGSDQLEIPEGCNPLAPDWDCLVPYPSDFFLVPDSSLPSGRRVELPPNAQPVVGSLEPFDPTSLFPADGFSPLPAILVMLPFAIDETDLVFHTDDVTSSTAPEATTVILDVETGEQVLHFAELDPREEDETRRTLIIRPLDRLRDGARYVVAIQGLHQTDGTEVPPGAGFALLRDGEAAGHPVLGQMVDRFDQDVFAPLEVAGLDRAELQLAWDFTVATTEGMTRDMLRVRDLAMEVYEAEPPAITVVEDGVADDYSDQVARRIEATIEVPLFLESTELGALLHRDADGQVAQNGTAQADVLIIIPPAVAEGSEPARIVQFGHGFYGTREEMDGEFPPAFADRAGVVMIAVDFWGFSDPDQTALVEDMLEDMGTAFRSADRTHQAMANQMAVTYAARATLSELAEMEMGGRLVYDPSTIYFYGLSMGHILGATYVALSPHIERAALAAGGVGFSHMAFRSLPFSAFVFIIGLEVDDRLEQQKLASLHHASLDRIDPATYAPFLFDAPLSGAPAERRILMQCGVADPYVPNVMTHVHARMLGLPLLQPAPRAIAGLEPVDAPTEGSAFAEFDFDNEPPHPGTYARNPTTDEDNGVHQAQRMLPASMDQASAFFRPDGVIDNFCDGVCDPE